MNAMVQNNEFSLWLQSHGLNENMWSALSNSIFPGAKPESIVMAVEYARARNLDIMKKPCHIVGMNVTDSKTGKSEWRDVIMSSITEQRITASRTGSYAGQDAPIFGDMVEIRFGNTTHRVPEFCTVTVYRIIHGEKVKFSHTEYFEEACATKKDGNLNAMWTKRKRGQLSKCAEAGALRKAFPEELGNEYTIDEMEGKAISVGGEAIESAPLIDNRPTLTDAQVAQAIKKIQEGKGKLEDLDKTYNLTEEQYSEIQAKTEVLEHDPV